MAKIKKVIARSKVRSERAKASHKPRYAYASDLFIWSPPLKRMPCFTSAERQTICYAFTAGVASSYSPDQLAAAGVFDLSRPLLGGIFERRENIKYIILHSTETGRPAPAERVIRSWNRGMRHPGAQYVVDRDGVIYQTVDPVYATVHVDIFRTINGVNNDNSIGIEIVRAGKQLYTNSQIDSVVMLVDYLQKRFCVANECVYGHGQIQPSDRTDPVGFDWLAFADNMREFNVRSQNAFAKETQLPLSINKSAAFDRVFKPTKQRPLCSTSKRWTLLYCEALVS